MQALPSPRRRVDTEANLLYNFSPSDTVEDTNSI